MITAAVDNGYKVTYAGHSMGGAVGVLAAASDERIGNWISLGNETHRPFTIENLEKKPRMKAAGEEADCPLSLTYKNDMYDIGSVANKAGEIKVPWLLVHGDEDDVVSIEDSWEIFALASEPKMLRVWSEPCFSEGESPMIEAVISWLGRPFVNRGIHC